MDDCGEELSLDYDAALTRKALGEFSTMSLKDLRTECSNRGINWKKPKLLLQLQMRRQLADVSLPLVFVLR
jgi:hypothetical protein